MKPRLLLSLLLLAALGFIGYKLFVPPKAKSDSESAADYPSVQVKLAQVHARDLPLVINTTGHIEAKASVVIKARIDGTIAGIQFEEGKPVHKGQPLVRLDPAVTEAQVRQAQSVLAKDKALLAKARNDLDRNRSLADKGFISEAGLSQLLADADAAQASVNADQAALDTARLQLGYTQINAPSDGVAGTLQIPLGGTVQANVSPILVINQMQPIYVSFNLAEKYIAQIRQALKAGGISVKAKIANVDHPVAGKLSILDNGVDASTGSIVGKAIFDNSDLLLTPGQFAEVAIEIETLRNVICVPSAAVEDGLDGSYVFVLKADSTAEVRKIRIGVESEGFTVVTEGLKEGEHVVVDGQSKLRNASKVHAETH